MLIAFDIFGIFIDFFANIFNVVMILIFLCVGVIVGILLKPWFGNQVIKLIPREHRFIDFDVEEETACSIVCKLKKGLPPQRFYKYKPGYTGTVGMVMKKPITRFFGKEGTAYTWGMSDSKEQIKIPMSDALKHLWTEEFYKQIPDKEKTALEKGKIDVIIDIDEGLTPEKFRSVSEEDIKREEDREAARTFWKGKASAEKSQMLNLFITALAGFGVAVTLQVIGILRIPSGTTSPPATTQATAFIQTMFIAFRAVIGV